MKPIQIWRARLRESAYLDEAAASILSPGEVKRSERFINPQHGKNFLRAHVILRQILSRTTAVEPGQLVIETGKTGKPALVGPGSGFYFNLAHSGDLVLVAVSEGEEVGIDVEQIHEKADLDLIARQFFAPHEADWLDSLLPGPRLVSFYRLWTMKEAVLKAKGIGLEGGLARVKVGLTERNSPSGQGGEVVYHGERFQSWVFEPQPAYIAALAILLEKEGRWDGGLMDWPPV
jgi:4'-phosphopantetheinyl transferase